MSNLSHAQTFAILAYRDFIFILKTLKTRLIDGIIITSMQVLLIGYFLPILGMPAELIAPWFIGVITQIVFSSAYNISFKVANDLHKDRFINYQISLPLTKTWLFVEIIISFMVEIMFVTLPLVGFGSILLKNFLPYQIQSWTALLVMYILSLATYSLIFLSIAYSSSFTWFIDNVWARRLGPLFLFGSSFFPWKKLLAFNATIAYICLLNPITYIHEGLRSALFGSDAYIPTSICIFIISIICIALIFLFTRSIQKRLDPV